MPLRIAGILFLIVLVFSFPSLTAVSPNILLITIDTLRADHLGCYGYKEKTSPHIDRMAASGLRFETAYSAAPITLPSHATILKGVYPNKHGFRDNAFFPPSSFRSFSEILQKKGYHTAAFVSGAPLSAKFGLDSGFAYYDDDFTGRERIASETTARALEWLKNAKRPFFLWVHYFDPHAPYEPPESFRKDWKNPYDGEIAYVDSEIGKLWNGIGENAVIALTADHGESLGEHGESTHGVFLYDSTLRVPLILRGPEIRPKVVSTPVMLCDIAPTLLEMAGLSTVEKLDGASLLSIQQDRSILAESLYASRNFGYAPLFATIQQRKKYILAPQPEFYDLASDPGEKSNLISKSETRAWKDQAEKYAGATIPSSPHTEVPEEELEKLRSLGYVGASLPGSSIDPKSKIAVIEQFNAGMGALYSAEYVRSESIFRALLKVDPTNGLAYRFLGDSLSAQEKYTEAIMAYSNSIRLLPAPEVSVQLAKAYNRIHQIDKAEEVLKATIKQYPDYFDATFELASLYEGREDWASAQNLLSRNLPEFANQRGILLLRKNDPKNAASEFLKALESQPKATYWNNLGIAYQQSGQFPEAKDAFTKALVLNPSYTEAEANLSFLLVQLQEWDAAQFHLEHVVAANSNLWSARFALGVVLENLNKPEEAKAVYRQLLADAPPEWSQRSKVETRLMSLN